MEAIQFEHPEYLWGFALVPLLVLLFYLVRFWRIKAMKRFGDYPLIADLITDRPKYKYAIKFWMMTAAFVFLIFALANPQVGVETQEVTSKGIDVMLALDVSKSMLAEDVRPNRLERSKQFLSRLIDKMGNNRVGLVIFAGNAYLQMPLTIDHGAAKMYLRTVDTEIVPTQGTAIGEAISLTLESMETSNTNSNALIIISDGENHEEGAIEIAKDAGNKGLTIITIGVGSTKGAPIPEYQYGQRTGYKTDQQNNIVLSKLNEAMLREISQIGTGTYSTLGSGSDPMNNILGALEKVEKKDLEEVEYGHYVSYFQVPLAIAAFLLLIEMLISRRRSKTFSNWKIFKV